MSIFDSFERKHDYLVCVDSDGCVMDTMNCKHFHCFGPCMVTEWGLEEWKEEILDRWNVINLFSMTRGINRFKGLAMALGEIDKQYKPITGIAALQHWADTAPALSNDAVAKMAAEATDADAKLVFEKALSWSKAVNTAIVKLDESLKVPYNGAKEGLAAAHTFADVAMVSSANRDAVEEEWGKFGLLEHTDIVLAQDVGSKAACIKEMLKFGYDVNKVVMIGDAPGDCDAAEKNGVHYYPILVNHEKESWDEAIAVAFGKLMGRSQTFIGAVVGNLQCFIQLHNGSVDCLGPVQSLGQHQLGIGVFRSGRSLGSTVVGQSRSGISPVDQCIHTGNFGILAVDLLQCHGQSLETVDAAGHGEQVDDIPAVQNLILPLFQAPLGDHTGTEAVKMLAIHGVHDAAVRVYTDQVVVLSFKGIKNRHSYTFPAITYGYRTCRSMRRWGQCP